MAATCYTSLTPEASLAESLAATRYFNFPLSQSTPMVLVSGKVTLQHCLDLRESKVVEDLRIPIEKLIKEDWRAENRNGQESLSQAWGRAFFNSGVEGVIIPSAALSGGYNSLVFPQNLRSGSCLEIINEVKWE